RKPGGIPQFVDEMTVPFHPFLRHLDVSSLGGKSGERHAKCVGPVLIDHRHSQAKACVTRSYRAKACVTKTVSQAKACVTV
ncbi:MAG: hypothetical protein R6W90_15925, partial [Ignavibacteriaceae bacterium]